MVDYAQLREEAIALRRQGFSLNQIGRRLGRRSNVVSRWVRTVPFEGFNAEALEEQARGRRARNADLYHRAIELRKAGWSYKMIGAEIGVSKSTLSIWLRDELAHTEIIEQRKLFGRAKAAQTKKALHQRQHQKIHDAAVNNMRESLADGITGRELFFAGLMLYWAEGAKTYHRVALANSDPSIIRTFVRWLKHCLNIERQQLRAIVHTHPDVSVDEAEEYWSEVIGIPRSQFYPTQIDVRTNKSVEKRGKLLYGTMHVTVTGPGTGDLHRTIMGWIAGFGEYIEETRE